MKRIEELGLWIRDEHSKVMNLSNRLRERTAVVPRANLAAWIAEVRERFEHFRAHMTRHMALEEREGYLPIVLQRRPGLAPQLERIQHEHQEFLRLMDGIHGALSDTGPDDRLLVRDSCRRIEDLLSYVEHHEELENNLLLSVCVEDIGTKD
jgi:iron-sulfur cluster repair protein YtfE (RIC family)